MKAFLNNAANFKRSKGRTHPEASTIKLFATVISHLNKLECKSNPP